MNSLVFSLCLFFLILNYTQGLGEDCKRNSECLATKGSLCIDGECRCDDLSYHNETRCLQYATEYNALCEVDDQCMEWLGSDSICKNSRCVCSDSYRWYKGKCQKYVDKKEACQNNDDCYNGYDPLSLQCISGTCSCNPSYYDREFDCRNPSIILLDCAIDLDCRSSLLQCKLGKCASKEASSNERYLDLVLEEKTSASNKTLVFGDEKLTCQYDADCFDMANSLCDITTNTCGCNEETHYLNDGNCVEGLSRCEVDDDCSDINNAMCFNGASCVCKQGFFIKDKKCIAELGMKDPHISYSKGDDCPIKPGKVVDSVCYCKNYWFTDESNRNCIKTMTQSTMSCLTNEWCYAMGPYSFCNSTSNTCQCSSIAKLNQKDYYCEKQSDETEDMCRRDIDCKINERCLDEKCQCLENFSRNEDDVCVPKVGGSCTMNSCSNIDNSNCIGGICRCNSNYIGKEMKCLKIADGLENPCEEQEQCQNIKHAVCGESEVEYSTVEYNETRCVCEEGYTDINEMCYQAKRYGDPCMTESDCTLVLNRSYKCRNSLCQCDVGHTLKNGYCSSTATVVLATNLLWIAMVVKIGFL